MLDFISYYGWLISTQSDGRYGKLVTFVYRDKTCPKKSNNYDKLRDYFIFNSASNEILDLFEESYDEFKENWFEEQNKDE